MRILLDSRDLINVVEHGNPVTADQLREYLQNRGYQIVLCFSNVREFATPLSCGVAFLEIRPLLQSLERIPHVCMKEAGIFTMEIRAGVDAFANGQDYRKPSPYVDRWDNTVGRVGQQSPIQNVVNLRLDDIVFEMYRHFPGIFASSAENLARYKAILDSDRAWLQAHEMPNTTERFTISLKKHAHTHQVDLPVGRENEFADWVYSNPNRCTGLRLNQEIFWALTQNYGDNPEVSDFVDFALASAIPYVDAATLDRRMRRYCDIASRKMKELGATHNYRDRVYEDIADVMRHL